MILENIEDFPSQQAEAIQKHLKDLDEQGKLLDYFKEQYQDLGAENSLANYIDKHWNENGKKLFMEYTGIETFSDKYTIRRTGVKLNEITKGSNRYFLWKCSTCQYEWIAIPSDRTRNNPKGCLMCAHKKHAKEARLNGETLEHWCNTQGEYGQQLKAEFTGKLEDNTQIKIEEISKASHFKVWWHCSKCNYNWISTVYNRTYITRQGCPACNGNSFAKGINDLETFCKEHSEFNYLLDEFIGEDIEGNKVLPSEISKGSNKKIKWRCTKCNYEWFATAHNRTSTYKQGCPACSQNPNRAIIGINDLETWCNQQGEYGAKLKSEFTGKLEDGTSINIKSISKSSNKRVYWHCSNPDCNYEWIAIPSGRTSSKRQGCPACAGKICIPGKNDLETYCKEHPEFSYILEEFMGIDENNKAIKPSDVTRGSNKRAYWKCNKCHKIWLAAINGRTYDIQRGCPYCSTAGTSFPEQYLFSSLKQLFPKTLSRAKTKDTHYEYDIVIPEINTCIEYSGYSWHQDRLDRDELKEAYCKSKGINFLQIYAHNGDLLEPDTYNKTKIVYQVESNKSKHILQLQQIIKYILKEYNNEALYNKINFKLAEQQANKVMGKA